MQYSKSFDKITDFLSSCTHRHAWLFWVFLFIIFPPPPFSPSHPSVHCFPKLLKFLGCDLFLPSHPFSSSPPVFVFALFLFSCLILASCFCVSLTADRCRPSCVLKQPTLCSFPSTKYTQTLNVCVCRQRGLTKQSKGTSIGRTAKSFFPPYHAPDPSSHTHHNRSPEQSPQSLREGGGVRRRGGTNAPSLFNAPSKALGEEET